METIADKDYADNLALVGNISALTQISTSLSRAGNNKRHQSLHESIKTIHLF